VQVHDPVAMTNVQKIYGDRLSYSREPYSALDGADALAIVTDWNEFRTPDFDKMRKRLQAPVIFDVEPVRSGSMRELGSNTLESVWDNDKPWH